MHLIAVLNRFSLLSVILYLLVIAVILGIMILLNRNSYQTLLWMFLIVFFPLPGFIIYLILGVDLKRNKLFAKSSWREDSLKQGNFFLTENNLVDVLSDGREAFAKIEQALKEAKDHIHLEFYIIRNDNLGNKIKEILIGKAQEGVEVRVLYDWFGGLGIRKSYVRELRTNGIKVYSFLLIRRYFPSLHGALNYRNHRKIIVVDGKVGFLGGLNIGDEYIDTHRYRYWRDTHLKVEGEAVHNLQKIFFRDWHLVSGEQVSGEGFFPIMER
jgi:cardiolipin synthase